MNRILTPLLLALLLPSCWVARTKVNEPTSPELVEALVPGRSTATDVVAALGAPAEVVYLGKRSAYRYEYVISKGLSIWLGLVFLQNQDTQSDRVWIWLDERDVVSHVASSFDADDASYSMPWSDRD